MSERSDTRRFQFGLPAIFLGIALASAAFAVLRSLDFRTITSLLIPYIPVILVLVLAKSTQAVLALGARHAKSRAEGSRANATDESESK